MSSETQEATQPPLSRNHILHAILVSNLKVRAIKMIYSIYSCDYFRDYPDLFALYRTGMVWAPMK